VSNVAYKPLALCEGDLRVVSVFITLPLTRSRQWESRYKIGRHVSHLHIEFLGCYLSMDVCMHAKNRTHPTHLLAFHEDFCLHNVFFGTASVKTGK
jgi:hypothetical protein